MITRLPGSFALLLGVLAAVPLAPAARSQARPPQPSALPRAVTSFGAASGGGWLYVYGGHIGREHAHSRDNVVGDFYRLNLADGTTWQALPTGPALQGLALVCGPDGQVYRIGGLQAFNAATEEADLHSTAEVAAYDPDTGRWRQLTPLPEPRSSHDAIVHDGVVYVVGGWTLAGADRATWLTTAWRADLRREPLVWETLPAPAPRRAAALAVFAQQLAILGGMDENGMLDTVAALPFGGTNWQPLPALPGTAFGTAAIGHRGDLLATVMEGQLLRLTAGATHWQPCQQLEVPRFFHRLVANGNAVLALGGAGRGGHMRHIECLQGSPRADFAERVVPAIDHPRQRTAFVLHDNAVFAFGGNRGDAGDRLDPAHFDDGIWRIDLLQGEARRIARLPHAAQSLAAARAPLGRTLAFAGGLGRSEANEAGSLRTAMRFDPRRPALTHLPDLPEARTQTQLASFAGKLWLLGGTNFTPDAAGGTTDGNSRAVYCLDPAQEPWVTAGWQLPRPRRSFAVAELAGKLLLVGGLGLDFAHAGPIDVIDPLTGEAQELAAPVAWVSPQVAVIGERLYVACGGTMQGQRFREDRALWSWSATEGWRCVLAELPFAVRDVAMLGWRNRLLFVSAKDDRGFVLRSYEPDSTVHVVEAAMHR